MHASVKVPSVVCDNFLPVSVTIPQKKKKSTKSLLCSLQVFVNTVLCDWKTLLPALISHCDIPAHHEPCSTFGSMPWFCIFDGALAGEGEEENRGFPLWCLLWDYSSVTWGKPDSAVWAHTQGFALACRGWTSFLILILPAALPVLLKCFLFYITAVHFFYSLHFTELQCIHINTRVKRVTSRWSRKPSGPTIWSSFLMTAAPSGTLSCCRILN